MITTTRYDGAAGTVRTCRRGPRTLLWAGQALLAACFASASVQNLPAPATWCTCSQRVRRALRQSYGVTARRSHLAA